MYPFDEFIFYYFKTHFNINSILLSGLRVFVTFVPQAPPIPLFSPHRPNNIYSSARIMNSSLVYSVQFMLQFDAVQHEMPAAASSKGRKSIHSHVTPTEAQWINSV